MIAGRLYNIWRCVIVVVVWERIMFRQRMNEVEPDNEQFMTRVCELPVVNDGLTRLSLIYSGLKEHNRLFRYTLSTAECGVHAVVSHTFPPVAAKFEKPSK